jgi:peptidyl-prolyl cis-trans isomerase C
LVTNVGRAGLSPEEEARRGTKVATVGAVVLTRGTFEDRLAAVPVFQLISFGASPDEIRKNFLERVVVRDELLRQGAEKRKLTDDPLLRAQVARARADATFRATDRGVGPASDITEQALDAYYQEHISEYVRPERIQVWRILVKTRAEAVEILETAKKDGTPKRFTELAREKSLDKVSHLRSGNLGFLAPDGMSSEAGLKVDKALVDAARSVRDGEFVPEPVVEGDNFAVVWRRGTTPGSQRTKEAVLDELREGAQKQRLAAARKKLLEDLRSRKVSQVDTSALSAFEVELGEGAIFVDKGKK